MCGKISWIFLGICTAILVGLVLLEGFLIGSLFFDSPDKTDYICLNSNGIVFTYSHNGLTYNNDFQFMTDNEFKTYCYNRQIEGNR